METEQKVEVSQDEQNAEAEILAEAKVDEIRTKVITDYGLTEDDNKELIDKIVADKVEDRKILSTAVGQKIDWRTKAIGATEAPEAKKDEDKTKTPLNAEEIRKEGEAGATAALEQRDLDEMDHSDEIKAQIKKVAGFQEISIRKAEKDPYIQSLIVEAKKRSDADEAADNGSGGKKSSVKVDVSKPLNPDDFDLTTEEGRQEWSDAKKAKRDANKT